MCVRGISRGWEGSVILIGLFRVVFKVKRRLGVVGRDVEFLFNISVSSFIFVCKVFGFFMCIDRDL